MSAQLVDALQKTIKNPNITGATSFDRMFYPKGIPLQKGSYIRRENFADFLELVGRHGSESKLC